MLRRLTALFTVLITVPSVLAADSPIADGYWRFSQMLGGRESPFFVLKVETKDGKQTASFVEGSSKLKWNVGDLKIDRSTVTLSVGAPGGDFTFEGVASDEDAKVIRGALFNDSRAFRAALVAQGGDKIERPAPAVKTPAPMLEAQKLVAAVASLRGQIFRSKDANNKAELQAKLKEAQKELDEKSPPLYREVIAKHADSPSAVDAANQLILAGGRIKPTADEVATWVKIIEADAKLYGPRITRDTLLQTGELLARDKEVAALALPLAERIVRDLRDKDPLIMQSRALKLLAAAQKAAGKTDAGTETRLAKVEAALDEEYIKTVPPFKCEKYAGRKDKAANRVVVMELFTGAQCPPCVAADVAFDALEKAYDHNDLILIQYHMHIPGPDPLTNPDAVARWDFYRDKFPNDVRGTPTTLFNGKTFEQYDKNPMHRGGGGMANAQNKFNQYKAIIDGLLEERSPIKIDGSAKRSGDKVSVNVSVDGVAEPSSKIKLRVILLEESIKYVGGNGLRYHHQVARKIPAPVDVTEKSLKKSFAIDLGELKSDLTKYLDDYAKNERPFPYPERPMEFKNLKAVALIQNDNTGEIMNAVQLDVK